MLYDLNRLGQTQFERLVQALLSDTFGVTPPPFARGRFAERESIYRKRLAWPSDSRHGIWTGDTLLASAFLASTFLPRSPRPPDDEWLTAKIGEIDRQWRQEISLRKKNRDTTALPEHFLLITNIQLPAAERRDLDTLMHSFAEASGLTDYAIWGYDELSRLLDTQTQVREQFYAFISSGDISHNLSTHLNAVGPELADTMSRYAAMELIADQWVRLTQAGDTMHGKIPLSRLAIDLPLQFSDRYAAQDIIGEGNRILRHSVKEETPSHIVLLGGPGQGKTTISQLLCQAYRAALLTDASWLNVTSANVLTSIKEGLARIGLAVPAYRRWPLRVELSAYADAATSPKRMSLLRYISEQVAFRTSDKVEVANVRNWLRTYPWLLALDGLDEVASAESRDVLMERISEFLVEAAKEDADLFVIVTTRPQGYSNELEAREYTHLTLAPLSPGQAATYARRLAEVRHSDDPDMCRKLIDRMDVASAEESTARLMRSPLQVTIMSLLLEARERAPQARYALFESYYETIYAREAAKPGMVGRLLQEQRSHINVLHDRVGLLLQVESEKAGGADASIPQSEMHALISERLLAEGYHPGAASILSDEIVTAVTSRLVLIVPKALDDVGYEVRSIQEFFAARAIVFGSDAVVIDRLRRAAPAVHWRNTWLFAAGRVFAQREHLRLNLIALLSEIDTADMLSLVVAPGADLALDLLDDDLTATTPRLQRMLGLHALTLLDHPPDQDLERRAPILFRNAERDRVIRAAAERALDGALRATPAQAKSATVICQIWRGQDGELAIAARKLHTRRLTPPTTQANGNTKRYARVTIADLVRKEIQNAQLNQRERDTAAQLINALRKVRVRENPYSNSVSDLASDREVSREIKDACFSCPPIVDAVAAATIDAANYTWARSSALRNMLRSWLQRQPVGRDILAITPFTDAGAGDVG